MNEIDPEDARTINRSDVSQYSRKMENEICFLCRVEIFRIATTIKEAAKVKQG
jgi:hypothetical protein